MHAALTGPLRRYGALRRRLLVCFVWWVSAVFVFYGLAVRAAALGGPRHATYALLAAAELPALLANTLLLDRAGRRPLLTAAFLLTAVSLVAIPCLPGQYRPRRPQPPRSRLSRCRFDRLGYGRLKN